MTLVTKKCLERETLFKIWKLKALVLFQSFYSVIYVYYLKLFQGSLWSCVYQPQVNWQAFISSKTPLFSALPCLKFWTKCFEQTHFEFNLDNPWIHESLNASICGRSWVFVLDQNYLGCDTAMRSADDKERKYDASLLPRWTQVLWKGGHTRTQVVVTTQLWLIAMW